MVAVSRPGLLIGRPQDESVIRELYVTPMTAHGYVSYADNTEGNVWAISINGIRKDYELDNNGVVGAGRTPVPLGANTTATITNLAAVLAQDWGDQIRTRQQGNILDFAALRPETSIGLAIVSGTVAARLTANPQRALPMGVLLYEREISIFDQARGTLFFLTQFDTITFAHAVFRTSTTNEAIVPWAGQMVINGSIVDLINGGATPFVSGHVVELIVMGDRYE